MIRAMMIAATTVACATVAHAQDNASAAASFVDAVGKSNGKATLSGFADGVLVEIEVTGLPPSQWVAFHVHETGTCDPATGHDSAGGHFNPTAAEHGYKAEGGPHAGDMPNQYVGADGTLRAQVFNGAVRLDEGKTKIRGRALMIHAGPDDYQSQPSGDA